MTEIDKDLIKRVHKENAEIELHWFISSIISPEFPQIIETLQICSNLILYNSPQHPDSEKLIERGPPIILPLSSNKLETLKGIMTRDGAYITQLQVTIKDHYFNKVIQRLKIKQPVLLPQIITAKKAIDDAIELIRNATSWIDSECKDDNHTQLIRIFNDLLVQIQIAKTSLQLPTDPKLVFPINVIPPDTFEPELTKQIAVDLYINQAELCLDLKHLNCIHEKPWCEIDNKGKSYVDNLREEMKLPNSGISTPQNLTVPLTMTEVEKRLHHIDSEGRKKLENHGLFSNVISHLLLKQTYQPVDYITKCITYNGMVVMLNKKIEVSSPDPVLLSSFTKLDSIEYLISSFIDNINCIVN